MKRYYLASIFAAVSLSVAAAPAAEAPLPAGVVKPAFFDAHNIKVLTYIKGVGGLNVWQVERNGMQTVFYTTPDNKTLISGVLWDAASGEVQSDAYITAAMTTPENVARINGTAPAVDATPVAAAKPVATPGRVSAPISGVAALTGIKEGKGSDANTLYIVFDPRCPHCKNVFDQSRDFVRKGGSIKWIPTTVLGDPQDGLNRVATILQSRDPVAALNVVEHSTMLGRVDVKPETIKAIADNEAYFWLAFQRNPSAGQPSVPVAFFQTRDGAPQMVSDLDDPVLLQRVFKDMSK